MQIKKEVRHTFFSDLISVLSVHFDLSVVDCSYVTLGARGFFRGEAAIVSGQAAIEIVANFLTFVRHNKKTLWHPGYGNFNKRFKSELCTYYVTVRLDCVQTSVVPRETKKSTRRPQKPEVIFQITCL